MHPHRDTQDGRPAIEKGSFGLHQANTTKAAEANISLGSVSYSNTSEGYFHHALDYLRQATQIPGYSLSPSLQQYVFLLIVIRVASLADLSPRFLASYGRF